MNFLDVLGAIASPVSSVVSGIFGKKSQDSANKTNIQLAQMNNDWSEKMMDKQNRLNIEQWKREADYNTEMWNKTNEYNSASNQAKRLREAGLNPALMMSGGTAGMAQGASTPSGSSVGMPSPSQAAVQPYDYSSMGQAVGQGIELAAMLARNSAEVNNLTTQSVVAKAKARAEIAKMAEETRNMAFKNEINDITKDLQLTQMNENYLQTVQQRALGEEQEKLTRMNRLLASKELAAFDERLRADIAVMASQVELNNFNAQSEIGKLVDTLKKKGYKLSKSDETLIFNALKHTINSYPFKGMSSVGAAATLGTGIGTKIRSFFE